MEKSFNIKCPHCQDTIIIEELNCAIFRHAVLIDTLQQINPHSSKEICDDLIKNKKIFGCGKPFKIIIKDNIYIAEICDYI